MPQPYKRKPSQTKSEEFKAVFTPKKTSKLPEKLLSHPPHELHTPLDRLGWINRPQLRALGTLGITSLRSLLEHYPRRHEDRRLFPRFPEQESDSFCCLSGTVGKTTFRRFGRMRSYEAEIEEASGSVSGARIILRWFNLFHIQKTVLSGMRLIVYGRVRRRGKRLMMEHPEFEVVTDEDRQSIHLDRIVPIYPAGAGISVRVIRTLIYRALNETDWSSCVDPLHHQPYNGIRPWEQADWRSALNSIHFPGYSEELEAARRELSLRELLGLQAMVLIRRNESRRPRGAPKKSAGQLLDSFLKALPFVLTDAQKRAVGTIRNDMDMPHRMHRLLQGDVGSGKTVVAASAMLLSIEAGHRAILMAPTQILAEQHFMNFLTWLAPLGVPVRLLTANRKVSEFQASGPGGRPSAVIGTHALLHNDEVLAGSGLVVIDEQHKFGVLQRRQLASPSSAPDVLVMTATPIPRTLAQTLYGDLDISCLDELPAGRGAVRTAVRRREKLPEITIYMREQLKAGRQALIVYPLIEESEKLASKAAEAEIMAWRERVAPFSCSLLHGRMNAKEKESVMESFRNGTIKVLVSTSVIEVGVDVPNATFMLVENAERFGLAQLHQLRGRIGRGHHASTCVLIDGSGKEESLERLAILEKSTDGFVIAEEDLRLRGSGDILGTTQSGLPPLKIADLHRDADLIPVATAAAARILAEDPNLILPHNAMLQRLRSTYADQLASNEG